MRMILAILLLTLNGCHATLSFVVEQNYNFEHRPGRAKVEAKLERQF